MAVVVSTSPTLELPKHLDSLIGQTVPRERRALAALAKAAPPRMCIVEVGTFCGQLAISMAWGSAQGNKIPIYAVDPHTTFTGRVDTGEVYGPCDMYEMYKNLANQPPEIATLVYCVAVPSAVAAARWPPYSVALLVIDALHDTSSTKTVFHGWAHTLTSGSRVAFHDTNYDSVVQAIQELQDEGVQLTALYTPSRSLTIYDYRITEKVP